MLGRSGRLGPYLVSMSGGMLWTYLIKVTALQVLPDLYYYSAVLERHVAGKSMSRFVGVSIIRA